MTILSALGNAGHVPTLSDELLAVADVTRRAATFADGEYIPQMSRQLELDVSAFDAGRAIEALESLKPRIAVLDGGEDGLRLAQDALRSLGQGHASLAGMDHVDEAMVQGGGVVMDAIATGSAGMLFRAAESKVRDIADIALLESMSPDDVFRAVAGG